MRPLLLTTSCCVVLLTAASAAFCAEAPAAADTLIPADAVIVARLEKPDDLVALLTSESTLKAVEAVPGMAERLKRGDLAQLVQAVRLFETQLGTDWKTAVGKLAGGVTFAVRADQSVLLILDSHDGAMLRKAHELARTFAQSDALKRGTPDEVTSGEYRGVTGWTFGKNEAHAILGSRLILSNKVEALKTVVDLQQSPDKDASLAGQPVYQQARKALGPGHDGFLFVNLAMLNQNAPFHQALLKPENAGLALLLGGTAEALARSTWLAAAIDVQQNAITLAAVADGKPASDSTLAAITQPPQDEQRVLANLNVPGRIAALSFYRDLHRFYAAKDELFPERTSGLIFFENMMGIFFTGRDLTDEVLIQVAPEIRIVVAEPKFEKGKGKPKVQIPAFAAVLRMKDRQKFAQVAEEAWQKAVGLVNFTSGQQGQPGLIIDRPTQGKTRFTVARYAAVPDESAAEVDTRYNFSPSLAMPGNYIVISSTESLARDLIDAIEKEGSPSVGKHSMIDVDGARLATVLEANHDAMVRQNMVEEGHTREEAESSIAMISTVARLLGRLQLEAGTHEGLTRAKLTVQLNLP